jgi:hypothetical protein
LETGVRIGRLTLGFIRVLRVYIQQLVDYSSTIRPYPITAHSLPIYWQFYWQCPSSKVSDITPYFPDVLHRPEAAWDGRIKLVDNISEDKMTTNEPQQPATVAGTGHMGNVR